MPGAGDVTRARTRVAEARVSALPGHDLSTRAHCSVRSESGQASAGRGRGVQRPTCSVQRAAGGASRGKRVRDGGAGLLLREFSIDLH